MKSAVRRWLRHFRDVAQAILDSKGGTQFAIAFIIFTLLVAILIEAYLSGDNAEIAGQYAVTAAIGVGGLLWLWRPPKTLEPNRGPAFALLAWAVFKGLGATFWLLEDHSTVFAFLRDAVSIYTDLLFFILFFATARPRAEHETVNT